MAENAKWLDSIEGKTYQFTNALETMWNNMLNPEVLKGFIDFGTRAIQFLDTAPGKITAIVTAFGAFAKLKGFSIFGLGKEAVSSLQTYQQALYKIQALQNIGMTGSAMANGNAAYSTAAISAYAQAVDGLTAKKQAEMLATAGLNKVQIIEAMQRNNVSDAVIGETLNKMNLMNTTGQLNAVTVQEILQTQLSEEALKEKAIAEFLATNGSKTLSIALIEQMVNQGILNATEAAGIIQAYGLTGANTALAGSFQTLGLAIKSAFLSNPFGFIMMAIPMLITVGSLIKSWIPTTQDYIDKWNDVKQEIDSVNQELETTRDRIKELESQDALSFVDKQELELLRQQNQELERRLRLKKQDAENAGNKAQKKIEKDYEKNFIKNAVITNKDIEAYNKAYGLQYAIDQYMKNGSFNMFDSLSTSQQQLITTFVPELVNNTWDNLDSTTREAVFEVYDQFTSQLQNLDFINNPDAYVSGETYIDQAIQKIQEYKNELYDANGQLKEGLDDEYVVDITTNIDQLEGDLATTASELYAYIDNYGGDTSDAFVQRLQAQIDKIDLAINPVQFYNEKFDEIFGKYSDQKKALYELAEQGELTAASLNSSDYTPLMREMTQLGVTAQDVADHINALSSLERKQVIDPVFNIADHASGIDSIQENISEYKSALESLEDGSFTYSDFIDLTQKFPELAKGVDTSTKSFDGLANNLRKAIKSSPDDLIKDLKTLRKQLAETGKATDDIDQLIESLENLPDEAVKDLSEEYITLTKEINAAKKSHEDLQEAMSKNPNEGYETRGEAIEKMKELMSEGKVGSESELWSIAEKYGFTYDSANGINVNADALAEFIAIREKWYKTDDDGNYTYEGTEDFMNAVESAVKQSEEAKTRLSEILKWSYDEESGVFDFDFANENLPEIISLLSETEELAGLTASEFYDLLVQIGQFFDINWENSDDLLSYLNEIANNADDSATKINKYADAMERAFGKDSNIDLANRPVVSGTAMQEAGWTDVEEGGYATVYSSSFSNEDGSKTVVVTPILPNGEVLSPAELEGYANQLLSGEELSPDINIKLAEFSGEDSIQQAEKYSTALHEAQEQYQQLRDPLDIETTLNEDGLDGLKQITDLQGMIKEGSNGTTLVNTDIFTEVLKEAGYTEEQIDSLIKKIQEYQNVVTTNEDDPLGLNSQNASLTTIMDSLDVLGVKYGIVEGTLSKPAKINITSTDLITTLQQQGWTDAGIASYLQTLSENAKALGVTLDSKVSMSKEEIDAAIAKVNEMPEEVDTVVNVDYSQFTTYKTLFENYNGKRITNYVDTVVTGGTIADGTAHVTGTAFANGSWGASKNETALVGELGPELLVRNGRWTTVGNNGAEFTQIRRGDIIFNHKQTEDLLSKGYVTGRGKAYAEGTAFASGSGKFSRYDFSGDGGYTKYDVNGNVIDEFGNAASSLSDAADSLSDSSDEFKEVFDWIEVRMEELDETLGLLSARLENASDYSSKNSIIDNMIDVNESKISNIISGIKEYDKYAEKLLKEVPDKYHDAVKNGAIAIEQFAGETDEATLEAINNYREWAQKADELRQQLEEVNTEIRDLVTQKFDNIYEAGDVRVAVEDSQTEKLKDQVDLLEEMGEIASSAYYTAMMENSNKTIEYLTDTRKEMQKVFNDAVEAGQIIRGSNEWYEMIDQLYEVDAEIAEATKELEEFQNAINDIYWDNFEQLTNRLDYIKEETKNIIDLMGNDDMIVDPTKRKYDGGIVEYWTEDDVAWTKEGLATLGLYAQQMEIAEYQSKQYAKAIDDLTKDFKAGLYSENEYYEKLNELTSAQYDSIEAYYDAQDAIKDLNKTRIDSIKDGIEKEIEAYEELIDKQKEQLDSEKD